MTSDAFGYMNYDPNVAAYPSDEKVYYQITPIDIQICYKKLFDMYCGSFLERKGEFLSLLRLYNGDYRRTVITIETQLLSKESEKMAEVFSTKVEE